MKKVQCILEKHIIVPYKLVFANAITDLFYKAVHDIDPKVYTKAQKQAWAPLPVDYKKWSQRLAQTRPFCAMINGKVIGFIELISNNSIDCFYVDPNYQHQGIGQTLLDYVEKRARQEDGQYLSADVSFVARPLFEKNNYHIITKNQIIREGQTLINFTVHKTLL